MSLDSGDGSEDVADFLARIKELGDKRQREDEERTRKLEEDILQGRKEREARRAERARSISPTKDSPLASSRSSLHQTTDSPLTMSTKARSPERDSVELPPRKRESTPMAEPVKPNPPPSSAGLARSGTLSWQQRPGSRDSPTVRSRPLSNVTSEKAMHSPRATPEATSADADRLSMSQKAQALESKDPSWFRQTADRGEGSAAYRRAQDSPSLGSGNIRLPGLSREQSLDVEGASAVASGSRSRSPTHESSVLSRSDGSAPAHLASTRSSFASPLPLLPSRESTASYHGANSPPSPSRSPAMSPAQGRISPERRDRPASPTKGLGGFVQSAMMKRSDSVSKRVGGQQNTTLSRGNSISQGGSSTNIADEQAPAEPTQDATASTSTRGNDGFAKPALPHRSSQQDSTDSGTSEQLRPSTPTRSHSRTDSKRWSPTKSSWLEAAINKTEPPKPKPAASQQPSWMADLNKAKQNRDSVDSGKAAAHKEVTVGGLLRSPPMGSPTKTSTFADAMKPVVASPKPSLRAGTSKPTEAGDEIVSPGKKEEPPSSDKPNSPVLTKIKPDTPPKKDFRSSLKSRPAPSSSGSGGQPEFKNVFGKLKPAETKNFVAEDAFKSNILRGKAGLSVTGGPRPWQKKDEFKDSILSKKKEMREGTSVVNPGNVKETPEKAVPEALSKRQNMGAKPVVQKPPPSKDIPEALAKRQNIGTRPGSVTSLTKPVTAELPTESRFKAEDPVSNIGQTPKVEESPKPTEEPQADVAPPPKLTRGASSSSSSSSKLADRFNPALAGILARGPPASGAGSSSNDQEPTKLPEQPSQPSASLTHATKARARGPKRKAPNKTTSDSVETPIPLEKKEPAAKEEFAKQQREDLSHPETEEEPQALKPKPKPYLNGAAGGISSIAASIASTAKSRSGGDGSAASSTKSTFSTKLNTASGAKPQNDGATSEPASVASGSQPSSPELGKKPLPTKSSSVPSPKNPPLPGKKPETLGRASSVSKPSTMNKPLPLRDDSNASNSPKVISPKYSPVAEKKRPMPSPKPASPEVTKRAESEKKLAVVASTVALTTDTAPPETKPKPPTEKPRATEFSDRKPQPQSKPRASLSPAHQALTSFFNQPLSSAAGSKSNADTQALLLKSAAPEKIKTLRKEIWEVTGDGKKISMPSDQSHVLFENSMFLCSHVFGSSSGKKTTEVYLWCGHGVSPSAIEDAQLFCRNAARDAGGKLVIVEQGKEPSNFFEALGGIVITHLGSPGSARSARYVLCGRRHLGHIAFDEVEFGPKSLCSGFPHIVVAADGGKVYLWKGRGSGTDELGCARLIAMDLGTSGDIEEVDDGEEPAAFWKAFGASGREAPRREAERWAKKAAVGEKFDTRLFVVDLDARPKSSGSGFMQWARRASTPAPDEGPEQVKEISPYAQADVTPEGVFMLDSFFELFVIAGASAAQKLPSFHAALLFAQEYGVLATSLQDRPFIPAGKVVLGGAPDGMKMAFRRWRDGQGGTRRGESVVELNAALDAFEQA